MWIEGSLVSVTVETHPRYCTVSLSETLPLPSTGLTIGYLTESSTNGKILKQIKGPAHEIVCLKHMRKYLK